MLNSLVFTGYLTGHILVNELFPPDKRFGRSKLSKVNYTRPFLDCPSPSVACVNDDVTESVTRACAGQSQYRDDFVGIYIIVPFVTVKYSNNATYSFLFVIYNPAQYGRIDNVYSRQYDSEGINIF